MIKKKYDLEDRLVRFAGDTILFLKSLPNDKAGYNLTDQLIRSSTSAALNFGESQGAESKKDKIHKLGLVLKELKESRVGYKILIYIDSGDHSKREKLITECGELIAIIAAIIKKIKHSL